jgi:hypothetical protein
MQENELNMSKVTESEAVRMAGYTRMSLFRKRREGLLPFERDFLTGRISYKVADLLNLGKTR